MQLGLRLGLHLPPELDPQFLHAVAQGVGMNAEEVGRAARAVDFAAGICTELETGLQRIAKNPLH